MGIGEFGVIACAKTTPNGKTLHVPQQPPHHVFAYH
jgi:hypothetical protein